ncbi:MAG TPA: hypothetical protein VJ793_09900 [Anaerolineae bacterium]|nr:hypothetical protein [Anaerolineae bacterium]
MKVRSWYGLTGEIEVENELWHLVKIGDVALHHPPLVNLILRRRLPREDRLRLSYLHEFGHFQTLPIALMHALFILCAGRRRQRSIIGRLKWLTVLAVAHEAVWELASEAYVIARDGAAYRETYRRTPNPLVTPFWVITSSLGIGLSWRLLQRRNER